MRPLRPPEPPDEPEPAGQLADLARQLRGRYLDRAVLPGEDGIELICRALAAIDIHLEDRIERNQADGRMLDEARYAIERLGDLLPGDEESAGLDASDSQPASELTQAVNVEFLSLFQDEALESLAWDPGTSTGIQQRAAEFLLENQVTGPEQNSFPYG